MKVCLTSERLKVQDIESLSDIRDILQFPAINISQTLNFAENIFSLLSSWYKAAQKCNLSFFENSVVLIPTFLFILYTFKPQSIPSHLKIVRKHDIESRNKKRVSTSLRAKVQLKSFQIWNAAGNLLPFLNRPRKS